MPTPRLSRISPSRRSRQELLALRKEIVLTKIAVERAELAQSTQRWRNTLHGFRWVRLLIPGLSRPQSLFKLSGLLQRYPYVSSVASLAVTGLLRTPVGRLIRPVLKWGGLGVLAWQGYRLWQNADKPGDTSKRPARESRQARRAREAAAAQARELGAAPAKAQAAGEPHPEGMAGTGEERPLQPPI